MVIEQSHVIPVQTVFLFSKRNAPSLISVKNFATHHVTHVVLNLAVASAFL